MPAEYFLAAMEKLRTKFLNVPLAAVLQPATSAAQRAATEQKLLADAAPPVKEEELTAQQYFERGLASPNSEEQIRFYTQAIQLDPHFGSAYNNRGVARKADGDFRGALIDYDQAIRLMSDKADPFCNRAKLLAEKLDYVPAIADFKQYLQLGGGGRDGDATTVEALISLLEQIVTATADIANTPPTPP